MTWLALSCVGYRKDFLERVDVIKGLSLCFVVVCSPFLPSYLLALRSRPAHINVLQGLGIVDYHTHKAHGHKNKPQKRPICEYIAGQSKRPTII